MGEQDDEIVRQLALIRSTLQLALAPQLAEARAIIRSDDVSAAILDATADWVASTDLQKQVAKATKKSSRTVLRALPELVAKGALEMRGTERRPEYRRTGLI